MFCRSVLRTQCVWPYTCLTEGADAVHCSLTVRAAEQTGMLLLAAYRWKPPFQT